MPVTRPVRRRHTKSRWGCHDCKQRHIKCDENKPTCVNCRVAGRQCSFASSVPAVPSISVSAAVSPHPNGSENQNQNQSPNQSQNQSPRGLTNPHPSPADTTPQTAASRAASRDISREPSVHPGDNDETILPANMAQAELMHNIYSTHLGLLHLAHLDAHKFRYIVLDLAVGKPFLMNELLAFSSRHLAEANPEKAAHYQHQALQLQTHALRIFNEEKHQFEDPDTCLAIVFFSWLIGTHMLADVRVLVRQPDGSGPSLVDTSSLGHSTLDRFVTYMKTYRGLRIVTTTTWEVILTTEFSAVIHDGIQRLDLMSEGPETAPVRQAVRVFLDEQYPPKSTAEKENMSAKEAQEATEAETKDRDGFETAISRIQWVIDAHFAHGKTDTDRQEDLVRALSMWVLVMNDIVFARFIEKQPVAMAVLAHFAVLLFWCREVWIFGDVGALLLEDIARSMPESWQPVLAWPMEIVRRSTGDEGRDRGQQGDESEGTTGKGVDIDGMESAVGVKGNETTGQREKNESSHDAEQR